MTTQARELAKLVSNAGDLTFGDDIHLLSDAGVLNFGADNDVTLTHVADTGLLLNSSRQLQFGDSGTFIRQEADGVLDLTSDTEVEINATTIDINGNADISGTLGVTGAITGNLTGTASLATASTITANNSTDETVFPVFVDGATGTQGLETDTGFTYNPSTNTLGVVNLTVSGTNTIVDSVTMNANNAVIFEGATANAHETTLTSIDATGDRTISLTNVSGTLPVLAAESTTAITSTPEELNIMDGGTSASSITIVDADRFVLNDNGTMLQVAASAVKTYIGSFDTDAAQVFNESGNDVDFRVESNNNADMLFVDGGNDNVLLGTQNQGHVRLNQQLGLAVTGNVYGGISMVTHSSSASGNRSLLDFNRSRNTTIGSHTVVNSGDSLGTIVGRGDDGDEFLDAASIDFEVDGTPGDGDMPGRIVFATTADGAGSVTERHRISNGGKASWAAGGVGSVATQARDFTFYTEGSTNGVAVHSNDERLIFMGAAASSGSGVDTGYFQIENGGTAKIALNSNGDSYFTSGKLFIGDSASHTDDLLQIETPASGGGHGIQIRRNDSNNDQGIGRIQFGNNDDVDIVRIQAVTDGATDSGRISFHTSASGATSTERMRINSAGRIQCQGTESGSSGALNLLGEVGNSYDAIQFYHNSSTLVGRIRTAASSTTYTTSSDYRLKENVDYTWDATTRLKQLKPARFNFTADDTNTLVDGFLAHEVSSIVPEAITGEKDAVDSDGNPDYQGIDQSKLVPLLVKTVQELEARIATLEG